jgi:hypothetical protein
VKIRIEHGDAGTEFLVSRPIRESGLDSAMLKCYVHKNLHVNLHLQSVRQWESSMCGKLDPPFEVLAAQFIALLTFLSTVSCAFVAHEPSVIVLGAHGAHVPL